MNPDTLVAWGLIVIAAAWVAAFIVLEWMYDRWQAHNPPRTDLAERLDRERRRALTGSDR